MITVMQLLTHPIFHGFRLAGDASGIHNAVSGTAIFEWESKEDIEATFEPGEFVMTTLSIAKDDILKAETYLRALIERKVAAIAIKTVYHQHLSESIVDYANKYRVPVFFFEETYIDDLIYNIKNALLTDELDITALRLLRSMMADPKDVKQSANKLNPFFYENYICCCCLPKDSAKAKEETDKYYTFYQSLSQAQLCGVNTSHLMIKGNRAIILIFTAANKGDDINAALLEFISNFEITVKDFRIGVGQPKEDLEFLDIALKEAIFAALTCAMDNETFLEFKNIGINQILIPAYKSMWATNYYSDFYQKLTKYDLGHNSNLHETLVQYVKSGGDIANAAEKLFQHSNTIRYRLGKIKEILGISHRADAYTQMYVYARLHEISALLSDGDLI